MRPRLSLACLVVLTVLTAPGGAAQPAMHSPGGGGGHPIPPSRDVCWSDPPDLAGAKITSEIIGQYGLESQCADDFILAFDATITKAIGYGGYYNWAPGDPPVTGYNWIFYSDRDCAPDQLLATFAGLDAETFIGYDGFGYPTYKYEYALSFPVSANTRTWFVLQAQDHPFPPQWGRQQCRYVSECDGMFRSVFFSYPNWTPAGDLMEPVPFAQEFECRDPVPVEATGWGRIRGLYR